MPTTVPPYDDEFKKEAVDLYVSSGLPLKQIARELGISDGSLRKWRENEHLRRQREILKKAAGILAENPRASMS